MKQKDLHYTKAVSNSDFLYPFTFTRGKLWPLNGGQPFISEREVLEYAQIHKYTRVFKHTQIITVWDVTEGLVSASTHKG